MDVSDFSPTGESSGNGPPARGERSAVQPSSAAQITQPPTWFPAIILSCLVALPVAKVIANSHHDTISFVLGPCLLSFLSYGCLIGYGGQRLRRSVALVYGPWTIFNVVALLAILGGAWESFPGSFFLFLFYGSQLYIVSSKAHDWPLVGAICVASISIQAIILFISVFFGVEAILDSVQVLFRGVVFAAIPALVGYGPGWLLRRLALDATSAQPVERVFPRRFSLMSMFALTTAVAIFSWGASVIRLSPSDWIRAGICTLIGNVAAIYVCRYLVEPAAMERSLEELRKIHDRPEPLIQCPHCHQISRRNTCFCPHCKASYYTEQTAADETQT